MWQTGTGISKKNVLTPYLEPFHKKQISVSKSVPSLYHSYSCFVHLVFINKRISNLL